VRRAFTSVRAVDHPGGEPSPLPDNRAQPPALRKGQGYGRPHCPGPEAGLSGVHPPIRPCIGPAPGSHGIARRPLVFCYYDMQGQAYSQGRSISEELESQTTSVLVRWPWWHRRRPGAQRPVVNPRRQELETAKEILAEVFGAPALCLAEQAA
jgi:hypothetical protein